MGGIENYPLVDPLRQSISVDCGERNRFYIVLRLQVTHIGLTAHEPRDAHYIFRENVIC